MTDAAPPETLDALTLLEAHLGTAMPGAKITRALRIVPGKRAIFLGEHEGEKCVFRLALGPKQRKSFAAEWAELTRLWAYMGNPPNTVARPIRFDPDPGLLVMSHLPGKPLLSYMQHKARTEDHPALIARAAEWLHAYTSPTMEAGALNAPRWRKLARRAAESQPIPALAEIERRIVRQLRLLSKMNPSEECRTAILHNDFHLNNLIHFRGTLSGIDCGRSGRAPLVKDIARALTHMARHGMLPSGERHFGVDRAALETFSEAFDLTEKELTYHLPLLIGFEALMRVEHEEIGETRIAPAIEMEKSLLRDLRRLTG